MLCCHCNDVLDESSNNCCEACDLQDLLRVHISDLEAELNRLKQEMKSRGILLWPSSGLDL